MHPFTKARFNKKDTAQGANAEEIGSPGGGVRRPGIHSMQVYMRPKSGERRSGICAMNGNDQRSSSLGRIMPQTVDAPGVSYQRPGDVEDHASGREDSKGHQSLYIVLGQQSHGEHRRCRDHVGPDGVLCGLGVADQRVVYQVECGPYHDVEHREVVDEKE
jgi:hypothetical protein